MNHEESDMYRYIVKELTPSTHEPAAVLLTIVCEPLNPSAEASRNGAITLHLQAGTTLAEAQAIANTLQSKVKTVCQVQAQEHRVQ